MDHGTHATTGSAGIDVAALLVRLILLLATAFVAGGGLFGGRPRALPAAVAAALAVASAFVFDVNPVGAAAHAMLVVAVPALSVWRPNLARWAAGALLVLVVVETSLGRSGLEFAADTVYISAATAWFGLAQLREKPSRSGSLTLSLGLLLALAGAAQLLLSGVAFDRRLWESLFGLSLIAVVVLPLAVLFVRERKAAVLGVAVAFLAWTTFVALPEPDEPPVPGISLLRDVSLAGQQVPVLVSPQRPGRNLVHVPVAGLTVAGVPATQRLGADGYWAEVDLPAGRSDITLAADGDDTSLEVDTGDGPGLDVDPECATAALGGLVAGRQEALTSCPSASLSEEDAGSLTKMLAFLARRGAKAVTLVSDDSPRGAAAATVVRAAGLRVTSEPSPDGALVVVSGWEKAYQALTGPLPSYLYGVYLAPWLLNGPIVKSVPSSTIPLRFDPREQTAVSYAVALGDSFGGESPSVAGFRNWLGAQQPAGKVQLFASAQVSVMPYMDHDHAESGGQWVPGGTVVPVSVPLE
ncbi:hypothetical protein HFP15_36150 [Amycolatopsis sp. K13G38]|uniref:Uncharacterized protein n=1 Tax=Amycolatopsis acididurans TaxID=2724524 RepID=A0ABX1JFA4_9PSEU|nr:hypothetical protein [Amycolatopsis acididurans]NKQ58298.1 hypothetical protein [Amycolatopsis acididurans]